MLRDAEAEGLLTLTGQGGKQLTLLPPLYRALDRFIAEGMSGHSLTGAAANRAIAERLEHEKIAAA
jgi:hypothetical protein